MRKFFQFLTLFFVFSMFSQEKLETQLTSQAYPIGGNIDVEYTTQNQLLYPVNLLKKKISEEVTVYFTVSSKGELKDIEYKQFFHKEFETEIKRLLRYFIFNPAKVGNVNVASRTFLTFKFNPAIYKKYVKARGFAIPKEIQKFDTSFVIYEKADVSPVYYRGEDALGEFIIQNLEYPDVAVRQNLQGTVILSFIVEPNGRLSNIVAEKEFNTLCTKEAIRVIQETRWKPAKKDGKYVRYKIKYPIVFNLNNINKDNATSEQR